MKMWKYCGIVQSRNTRVAERAAETGLSNRTGKIYRIPLHLILPPKTPLQSFTRFTLHVSTPFNHRRMHPAENEITHTDSTTNLQDPEAETPTTTEQNRNVG